MLSRMPSSSSDGMVCRIVPSTRSQIRRRLFDAGSSGYPHVELNLAGIYIWNEVLPSHGTRSSREMKKEQEARQKNSPVLYRSGKDRGIAIGELL